MLKVAKAYEQRLRCHSLHRKATVWEKFLNKKVAYVNLAAVVDIAENTLLRRTEDMHMMINEPAQVK